MDEKEKRTIHEVSEWTADTVMELNRHGCQHTADAHNAALSAEMEISAELAQQVHTATLLLTERSLQAVELKQQLAAEREALRWEKQEHAKIHQQLREQRDEAIRLLECKEKEMSGMELELQRSNAKVAEKATQLAAAQACLNQLTENGALTTDSTAALDAAIAEAQKPLVDWIEEAADQLCGDKPLDKMGLLASYENLPLAKVKEGK